MVPPVFPDPAAITDFGACPACSAETNNGAILRALATGRPVYVPPAGACFAVEAVNLPSSSVLFGAGPKSCLRAARPGAGNLIQILHAGNVQVRALRLDGGYSLPKTTAGWTVLIGYSPPVSKTSPRIVVADCQIVGSGFGGIMLQGAHGTDITDNTVTATTDTGIGAVEGSSDFTIARNAVSGASFDISISSQGETDVATVGLTRDGVVEDNALTVDKANGYGVEVDGIERMRFAHNSVTVNGGRYGFRVLGLMSRPAADIDLPVRDTAFVDNGVTILRDQESFGVDITGDRPVDLSSNRFDGFTVTAPVQQAKTTGLTVNGGVGAVIDRVSVTRVAYPITITHAGAAGVKTTFHDPRTRGGVVGFSATSVDAARDRLVIVRGDFQGASYANIAISDGEDATLVDTPRVGRTMIAPHSLTERRSGRGN